MNLDEIYDRPGKSAMGMDLVPVYEDQLVGGVDIFIDPVTQQNMGIRTAAVVQESLTRTIRTYGHVTYDETRHSTGQSQIQRLDRNPARRLHRQIRRPGRAAF